MGKQTFTSRLVNCPICNLEVKSRGLHSHLRLVHPNSDLKSELRKKVMEPLRQNETITFSLSHWMDNYLVKHADLKQEEIEFLADFFYIWAETGSITRAQSDVEAPFNKSIITRNEITAEDTFNLDWVNPED